MLISLSGRRVSARRPSHFPHKKRISREPLITNNRSQEANHVFRISALEHTHFDALLSLDDAVLAARGARRYVADKKPGFPCRVSLQDAEPGERVILVPYHHQPADSPYRAAGPIFVREGARTTSLPPDTVPRTAAFTFAIGARVRCRASDEADVIDGRDVESRLASMFADDRVAYLHIHFARPGCYACRADRSATKNEAAGRV
jgi:uncharacterized protein DUF1203